MPKPGISRATWLIQRTICSGEGKFQMQRDAIAAIDDDRLVGLLAYLVAQHGGGFVNNTITRDELLSVLDELRAYRSSSAQDGDHANA
jgi:hypothetical protein